jgi:hypothetical protein
MTSFWHERYVSRLMWGIIGALSVICIRSVRLVHGSEV